ncbi:MAG: GNAT family N-acetyltransferase [Bacteroidales bacterium]|nr:GNAT family N-acetyltransferase [Bacteroidales bacterium]
MCSTKIYNATNKPNYQEKKDLVDFLFQHLEQYGDPKEDIEKAINYALKETPSFGGFVVVSFHEDLISGAVVINQTGMDGYIPENILVYIATHREHRGKGLGKKLMKKTLELAKGDVALHVEPDNPARFLYEKTGFSSKYVEMRFHRSAQSN